MARKIAFNQFGGIIPKIPDHNLPDVAASFAINSRLTDNSIRPFYEPVISTDINATLSTITAGYTNFIKASREDALAWLAWSTDTNVSIMEIRYNDLTAYVYPRAPESTAEGGDLNVLFTETGTANGGVYLDSSSDFHSVYIYTHVSEFEPVISVLTNLTQQVTGYAETDSLAGGAVSTYAWVKLSGDVGITIDNAAIANPTFTLDTLDAPTAEGTVAAVTKKAVWELQIDSTGPTAVGTKSIEVLYRYTWIEPFPPVDPEGGWGGTSGGFDDQFPDYIEEQ